MAGSLWKRSQLHYFPLKKGKIVAITKKSIVQSVRVGVLFAGKSTSHQYKNYFIHENRSIAMKKTIKNTAANYGRHSEKYQYSQPSANVHLQNSPVM